MALKVLLINPPPKQIVERRHDIPDYPNIGLGYIASYLETKGVPVSVLDAKLERLTVENIIEKAKTNKPDVIGLTAYTHEINWTAELAKRLKREFSSAKYVIGGIHATALPYETLQRYGSFDMLIHGEGEETFYELTEAINNRKDLGTISGLAYRDNSKIVVNSSRERLVDLDTLPLPAWHLFHRAPKYPILTARGCPFKCTFCMRPYGNRVRMRSPEKIIEEIEIIVEKFHPQELRFCDETFGVDKTRIHRLLNLMLERKIQKKVRWDCTTNVNVVDGELCEKMKRAGCYLIAVGVESGDPEILRATRKGITLEQAKKAICAAKQAGLTVEAFFIIGHPYETKKTAKRTVDFAVKLNPDVPIFGIMVPYPGTEIAQMIERGEGGYRVLSKNWDDYNKQIGNSIELENLSRQDMERVQMTGYFKVFIKNRRLLGLLAFMWQYRREGTTILTKLLTNHSKTINETK